MRTVAVAAAPPLGSAAPGRAPARRHRGPSSTIDVARVQAVGRSRYRGRRRRERLLPKVLSWALLATVVGAAVALIGLPKAVGGQPLTVLSGSMVPTYDPGDVVVVRPVDASTLQIGDVITFQPRSGDPRLTTHRIVGMVYGSQGRSFQTQGDANGAPDPEPVSGPQVRGEVWYAVPLVGHVSVWLAGGPARSTIDILAVGLLLYGGYYVASGTRERLRRSPSEQVDEADPADATRPSRPVAA